MITYSLRMKLKDSGVGELDCNLVVVGELVCLSNP